MSPTYISKTVIINALAFTKNEEVQIYTFLVNRFNNYSKKNNLNITVNLNLLSPANSTAESLDFFTSIDSYLRKKSTKYDIYFYENIYTTKFEPHFINLKEWLPKEHIDMFTHVEKSESYFYNNKLVGLPAYLEHSIFYYNERLLNKYNKTVPRTWDDMIETGKYILDEEKKQNNTDLMGYSGGFIDDEIGTGGIYEFIYSFRDSIDDPLPEITSQNAVNALKTMKRIKNEISSDSIFKSLDYTIRILKNGNGLFIKFGHYNWVISSDYKITILPGCKEGLSGSILGGYNIGISKYSDKEKLEASVVTLLYMTSKEEQRRVITDFKKFSGITSLYNDEIVCKLKELCEINKNVQPIGRPISLTDDYNEYSEKFRHYVYKYLYGDDSVDPLEMLKKIDDLTRIHYISIYSKDSSIGIIITLSYIALSLIILSSSILLFIKKFKVCYVFMTKDFWIL
ncbi:periplasmic binding protein-like II, partial [Anaeromyces robustus]